MSSESFGVKFANIVAEYNASRDCIDKGALCHAPESSLYFGRDGKVLACCYSREAPLGSYPEQTVSEIWNGAQADSMRAAMRCNELPNGCELCAEKLLARNFTQLVAKSYDVSARPLPPDGPIHRLKNLLFSQISQKVQRWPVQMEFELSNTCNLECAMCSGFFSSTIRAKREKLPALPQVYDDAFVEQLRPFLPHLKQAKFLGGEPFLIDIYYQIWNILMEVNPNCDIFITTNGTVYNTRVKRIIENLNCQIIISLDSINKPVYEEIRVNAKMEHTLKHVEAFMEVNRQKNKGLSIAICPMVSNWREMPDMVRFANERGMRVFFNMVVFPADHSLRSLPRTELREIVKCFMAVCDAAPAEATNEIERDNYQALTDLSNQLEYWINNPISTPDWISNPIIVQYWVQWLLKNQIDPKEDGAVEGIRLLLSDLVTSVDAATIEMEDIAEIEVKRLVKNYISAMWQIGNLLQAEGLFADLHYEERDLKIYLEYIEQRVCPAQAQRMYSQLRSAAKNAIAFFGTQSGEQLIEVNEAYTGVRSA